MAPTPDQLELALPPPGPPLPSLPDLWTPDDIYAALDASLLDAFEEDRRLERKTARTEPKTLGEYFSMWSNTSPDGGLIILGVDE